jgi:hypothetical protein
MLLTAARHGLGALVALAMITGAGAARAEPSKEECLTSFVEGQKARRSSELVRALEALHTCAAASCPAKIRVACAGWVAEVEPSVPTVVLAALGPDGRDLVDARVTIDGHPVDEALDGKARAIDPGVHVVRWVAPGLGEVSQRIVIHEGEKNRRVVARFVPLATPVPRSAPRAAVTRPIPTIVYALGGVTVAGAAVFTFFGLSGRYGDPSLATLERCKPDCLATHPDAVQGVKTKFLVADIGLVTGLVSLGLGAYFFATRPSVSAPASRGAARR